MYKMGVMFKPKVDTTRSDILHGQALIRGVKKWLIRGVCLSQFWKMDKRQTDRQTKRKKEKGNKYKKKKRKKDQNAKEKKNKRTKEQKNKRTK